MNFLNLSIGELMGLAGILSAGILALYLLDRSKRRHLVGTLRFWVASQSPTEFKRSRKIQQPWSLLLQIVSTLLLLLAIAGPKLGSSSGVRNHVVILDTSAWMGARARQGILLDQAKALAISFVNGLPADDRVMFVRADALATPVTPFSTSREAVIIAIQQSQPSASALNLQQVLDFAAHSQKLQAERVGDIVFAGAGRIAREDAEAITPPSNLRLLQIPSAGENVGLRRFAVRRAPNDPDSDPNSLDAFVAVRNDGARARDIVLELRMGKKVVASKASTLAAGAESETTFRFKREGDGPLVARVRSANGRGDSFPQDDSAVLDLPPDTKLTLTVYSNEPELLRPLLSGNPRVTVAFLPTSKYDAQAKADVVLFDRFNPPSGPTGVNAIWMDPPAGSPFATRGEQTNVKLQNWHSENPLAQGLFTRDVVLPSAKIFSLTPGDQAVVDIAQGPVVVARTGAAKMVALGFNPVKSNMRFELATPLLMANILRWMAPDAFRELDVRAGTVGTMSVPLEKGVSAATVHIADSNNRPLPFTIQGDTVQFFSGAPGIVHLQTGERESLYSLTVPDIAEAAWKPPSNVRHGLPGGLAGGVSSPVLWPWLAVLGGLGFLLEWFLYGRNSVMRVIPRRAGGAPFKLPWRKAS